MKIVLTAPHAHGYLNDVIASYITEELRDLLSNYGFDVETFINALPRSSMDMNRPPARNTGYRTIVREALKKKPDFLLDIHGFPANTDGPLRGHDIVVLVSYPGEQEMMAGKYYDVLRRVVKTKLRVGYQPATAANDVVKEAMELGLSLRHH